MCGKATVSYTHVLATDDSARLAGNDRPTVIQNKMKARIAITFCLLPGLFAIWGCRTGPAPESLQRDEKPKVRIDFRFPSGGYNLGRDEQRGGHTLARHVARTDEEVRERLAQERNISAASTRTRRETAEAVGVESLGAERSGGGRWMCGVYYGAELAAEYGA